MTVVALGDFARRADCSYEGEQYSVRDNGAVLRHHREGKRQRPADGQWTFGKPSDKTGYMEIASVRVHRIVATAFHGDPPTRHLVVDHIDTNRRNNRPENLRWVTRLENVLLNPISAKRIAYVYGSIEAFLANPAAPRQGILDPNFEWMRTVSQEEAQASLKRMLAWAKSEKPSSGGSLGEWLFNRNAAQAQSAKTPTQEPTLVMAKTPGAAQRNWRTPSEFPCCLPGDEEEPIATYSARLEVGATFARNDFSKSVVAAAAMAEDRNSLWVMCEHGDDAIKPWSLAQVTFENGLYVHKNLGTFFALAGAQKQFCLAQGREWTGSESIDDYC